KNDLARVIQSRVVIRGLENSEPRRGCDSGDYYGNDFLICMRVKIESSFRGAFQLGRIQRFQTGGKRHVTGIVKRNISKAKPFKPAAAGRGLARTRERQGRYRSFSPKKRSFSPGCHLRNKRDVAFVIQSPWLEILCED